MLYLVYQSGKSLEIQAFRNNSYVLYLKDIKICFLTIGSYYTHIMHYVEVKVATYTFVQTSDLHRNSHSARIQLITVHFCL